MLGDLFSHYGLRMAKDTDEITVDKSFVADHDVSLLFQSIQQGHVGDKNLRHGKPRKKFEPLLAPQNTVSVAAVVNSLQKLLLPVKEYGSADISGQLRQSPSLSRCLWQFSSF